MRFRSKMKKVPCNGYTAYVYRDPADAFPLFLGNEDRQFKAGLNILRHVSGELSGGNKAKAEQLLIKLNETNQSLQADFSAIYTVYASDPCRDRDYLAKKVDEIRRSRIYMETLFAHIRAIQVAIEGGATAEMIIPAIERAFAATISPSVRETVTLVEDAPREVLRWQQPVIEQTGGDAEPPREPVPSDNGIIEAEVVEDVEVSGEVNGDGDHE